MSDLCPSCGFNLVKDKPIEIDGYVIDQGERTVSYEGKQVSGLTLSQVLMLHSIAKASPSCISSDALLNRMSDSDNTNLVCVQLGKMRNVFEDIGVTCPVQTVWGRGYRWSPHPVPVGRQKREEAA